MDRGKANELFFLSSGINVHDAENIPFPETINFEIDGKQTSLKDYILERTIRKKTFPEQGTYLQHLAGVHNIDLKIQREMGYVINDVLDCSLIGYYLLHRVSSSKPGIIDPCIISQLYSFRGETLNKDMHDLVRSALNMNNLEIRSEDTISNILINYIIGAKNRKEDESIKDKEHVHFVYLGLVPDFKKKLNGSVEESLKKYNSALCGVGLF